MEYRVFKKKYGSLERAISFFEEGMQKDKIPLENPAKTFRIIKKPKGFFITWRRLASLNIVLFKLGGNVKFTPTWFRYITLFDGKNLPLTLLSKYSIIDNIDGY